MSGPEELDVAARPITVLYCESNMDGTVGGSHFCLLYLVERLDRTRYTPIVFFKQEHALLPRFRATAETLVADYESPVKWGADARGLLALPVIAARRGLNVARLGVTVGRYIRFLRARNVGLLHLNNSVTRHQEWMVAAMLLGIPCLTHERGLNRSYSFADRWLGARLKAIVPVAAWIREHMVARGVAPDNIRVLYDGLDPESVVARRTPDEIRAAWQVDPDRTMIGMVGNVREWKGQEVLVRALPDIVRARPDVVCFFVGAESPEDRAYGERLRGIVREQGLEAHVRWTGYQQDVPSFLRAMAVVVHASLRPEPFGMVMLEAMAQRKAVIGSAAGGVTEIVVEGETGLTFPPGDAGALASGILSLLADPARTARMGEQGYQRLLDVFSTAGYMRDIHRLYDAVLAGEAVPAMGVPAPRNESA